MESAPVKREGSSKRADEENIKCFPLPLQPKNYTLYTFIHVFTAGCPNKNHPMFANFLSKQCNRAMFLLGHPVHHTELIKSLIAKVNISESKPEFLQSM